MGDNFDGYVQGGLDDAVRYAREARDFIDEQIAVANDVAVQPPQPTTPVLPPGSLWEPTVAANQDVRQKVAAAHSALARLAAANVVDTAAQLGIPVPPHIARRASEEC